MYQVEWIIENRVLLFRGIGDQTEATVEDGIKSLQALINSGDAPVYVVSDSRYVKRFPMKIGLLKQLTMAGGSNPKSGTTVLVGGDSVSKFISQLLVQFSSGQKPYVTNTVGEALEYLYTMDSTLPCIEYVDQPPQIKS